MQTLAEYIGLSAEQLAEIASKAFDLLEAGQLEQSAAIFEGLLMLNPRDGKIHAALGAVYHAQGKRELAEKTYDEALQKDSKATLARVNRGQLRCQRGDAAGLQDLRAVAQIASPLQERARALLQRYQE